MKGYATLVPPGFRRPMQVCVWVPDGFDWEKRMFIAVNLAALLYAMEEEHNDRG